MRRSILITGLMSSLLAACSSTPVAPPAPPPQPAAPVAAKPAPPPTPVAAPARVAPQALPLHLDPGSALSREHSIYFAFDNDAIAKDFLPVIERHGQYLQHNPALKVLVQGNTDERGGREYNLALGQRRAQAVKAALLVYGAKEAQIEAASLGEEKPTASGHDESAWHQNRRADIDYLK